MKTKYVFFYALLAICFFPSCRYGLHEFFDRSLSVNERSKTITEIPSPFEDTVPNKYSVLMLSDLHFGPGKTQAKKKLFDYLESLKETDSMPSFALVLGDIADTGCKENYAEYASFVTKLQSEFGIEKVYGITGNHDLYNKGWNEFTKKVYPYVSYYRFETETFSWYFLDSGNGTLGQSQLQNFISKLKKDSKKKFVFIHYPLYRDNIFYFSLCDPRERAMLIDACAKNNVGAVFSGHDHYGSSFDYGPFVEYGVYSYVNNRNWQDGSFGILSVDEENARFNYTQY